MYSGRIIRVTNLRRHNNADRLQCTEICGYNIIVDDTCEIGELLVDDSWDIRTAFLNYPDKVLVTPGQDS